MKTYDIIKQIDKIVKISSLHQVWKNVSGNIWDILDSALQPPDIFLGSKMKRERRRSRCKWRTGTACQGAVEERDIFEGQLRLPICDYHFRTHKRIMFLYSKAGRNGDTFLDKSETERAKMVMDLGFDGNAEGV